MITACLFAAVTQDIKCKTIHIQMDKGEWRSKITGKNLTQSIIDPVEENILSKTVSFLNNCGYTDVVLQGMCTN